MTGAWLIYAIMGAGLIAYVLTAGADFGGGVWDLLARGPRKEAQREAISHAIAPIWEANHVWLIFIIVLMFSAFPKAYAVIGIALHVPIVLALVGIVLRGTAFTFRAYGISPDATRRRWGRVFGWSSSFTPLFMGMALAGVSSSAIELNGTQVLSPLTAGWLSLFAVLVGLFALVLFMLLAAVYLTCDTDGELQHDFRARALASEGVAGVIALLVFLTAEGGAPDLYHELARSAWTWPLQLATAAAAAVCVGALLKRRYRIARAAVAAQVTLVVLGWAAAMNGHLVMRGLHVDNAGAEGPLVDAVLAAVAIGVVILAPALWFLFRLFKRSPRAVADAGDST
jgi:cytochrome d ubiquinol oxidase subunit II